MRRWIPRPQHARVGLVARRVEPVEGGRLAESLDEALHLDRGLAHHPPKQLVDFRFNRAGGV